MAKPKQNTAPRAKGYRCSGCNNTFGRRGSFETHRIGSFAKEDKRGTRRCMTAKEMVSAGLRKNSEGIWQVEMPDSIKTLWKKEKVA